MTLSSPVKVFVGVLTLLVVLLPFALFLLWAFMVFPAFRTTAPGNYPFQAFGTVFALAFPLMCLFTLLTYGLIAFYVTHAIKNQRASDVVRIVTLIMIFFMPYLGMPFYYVLFILMPTPPSWALKPRPPDL